MHADEPREDRLRRRIAAPIGMRTASAHPDPELVAAHAAGELSPEYGLAITRHLTVCDDGRCAAVLRDVTAGSSAARDALYGRAEGASSDAPPPEDLVAEADAAEAPLARETPAPAGPATDRMGGPAPGVRDRVFDCPDDLWETFTALALDRGSTVDPILDEAMEAYARQRGGRGHAGGRPSEEAPPAPRAHSVARPRAVTFKEAPHDPPRERNTPTLARAYLPRAPASSRRATPHPVAYTEHLSVVLEGVRYEVTKERFVVGRGGLASDLAIDDPGVSRQHAVIEHAGGAYYLVDMGSTNGVEYQGERIVRKEIAHGDRFRIGDHVLEFLYT